MEKKLAECVNYVKSHAVFLRILKGFAKKYQSLGYTGGNVTLSFSDEEDREVLEGFLQKNYHGKKSASISVAAFEQALAKSRYSGITVQMLLTTLYPDKMYIKKEEEKKQKLREEETLKSLLQLSANSKVLAWLSIMLETKKNPYTILLKKYREGEKSFFRNVKQVIKAFDELPIFSEEFLYLPVFAAKITGNPHAFDRNTEWASVFRSGIIGILNLPIEEQKINAQIQQEIYYQAGILIDDLSNYTTILGIHAMGRYGQIHQGIEGFYQRNEPVQLPLSVVVKIQKVECEQGCIYAVENPSVFSVLSTEEKNKRSLICTNGQLRLSSTILLDKIVAAGNHIYYSGDLDPEGLGIAQRLKDRYGKALSFWHMSKEDYEEVELEMKKENLPEHRLKKLEKIKDSELVLLAKVIQERKKAVYQEEMLGKYLEI